MSLTFPDIIGLSHHGRAVVIGLPQSFDLLHELASADTIRLGTAFAHTSGWNILAPAISTSKAKTFLLAGKNFFQTEPEVLHQWLELSQSNRVEARLHTEKTMFHPKVLIVEGQSEFAIVGSGNLSRGGLHGNIECGVFVESGVLLRDLRDWFDSVCKAAIRLQPWLVVDYEKRGNENRKSAKILQKQQQQLEDDFEATATAAMKHWEDAVSAAKNYLASPDYQATYAGRVEGGHHIERSLHLPKCDFDETGWNTFYSISELGRIPAFYRDSIFQQKGTLQEGLRALIKNDGQVSEVLEEFLSPTGTFHIKGLKLNILSKVLVAHDPQRWSVYNGPVENALNSFGYTPTKGASPAMKFIEFTATMERFKSESGLPDGYALDAFMVDVYETLKTAVT